MYKVLGQGVGEGFFGEVFHYTLPYKQQFVASWQFLLKSLDKHEKRAYNKKMM